MRCETARRMMMDRLFESLPAEKGKMLNAHLNACASCAAEWNDVQIAHAFMKHLPDKAVPAHLQQAILQQSQSDALPPESISKSHNLWKWAAAAVIIITISVSYSFWDGNSPRYTNDAALVNPDLNNIAHKKLDASIRKTKEKMFHTAETAAPALQTDRKSIPDNSSLALQTSPEAPSVEAAVLTAKETKDKNAEELFREGLRLYNAAFTKTGKEQEKLLREVVLTLNGFNFLANEDKQWTSMGLILKADALRVLNKPEMAIDTYQSMIERFPDMPTYCREARASLIKLLMRVTNDANRIGQQLAMYQALTPPPVEFATLALAFSSTIRSNSPEGALQWCKQVRSMLPEQHPVSQKALQQFQEIELSVRDKYYVQDWRIVGPFRQEILLDFDKIPSKSSALTAFMNKYRTTKGAVEARRKPGNDPVIDVAALLKKTPADSCAFAETYVYSPIKQWVNIRVGFSGGLRVWLNGDPISGGMENPKFARDITGVGGQLQAGWNSLVVKSFHPTDSPEWKFSTLITDGQGDILPDIKYDSSHNPSADAK